DVRGKGIGGLALIAVPMGPAGGKSYSATSGPKGDVQLTRMRPGYYMFCVQLPGSAYLDPCRWSKPVERAIQGGQAVTLPALQIQEGSVLRVKLKDDPAKKYLGAAKAKNLETLLRLTVPNGGSHLLPITSEDATGRWHEIAIPTETALHLLVYPG